ncbi:MAG: hypothetical protein RBR87_15610 [Bacteroidales bacterium]|nr:hypothetical protein [Bacteroidales bacterium]
MGFNDLVWFGEICGSGSLCLPKALTDDCDFLPTANRWVLGTKADFIFLVHGFMGLKGFFVGAEGGAELVGMGVWVWFGGICGIGSLRLPKALTDDCDFLPMALSLG